VSAAVEQLQLRQTPLAFTFQNITEFWNVATRPAERNGFGYTVQQVEFMVREIETMFNFLPDTEAVYREWRNIVAAEEVKGVQVHDARLVAAMRVYGIHYLVTLNENDFKRYFGIVIVRPEKETLQP
ncbi:MAG TPA: PIN domain nuclease, partial [Candidatus Dormibacteraeota bacterium]|nr:PIN domain nuclease [Candidatus Dormibacteraeota bacterium]